MEKNRKSISILIVALIVLILLSEISLIAVTIANQNYNQGQRLRNHDTTLTVLRESYSQKCLLLISPDERTPETINNCDIQAQKKVDALR